MRLFNETFRAKENFISKSAVVRTIQPLEDSGFVNDCPKSGRRKSPPNKERALDVLQSFVEGPHCTISRDLLQHDIARGSVHKILKLNKWYPYKISLVHELSEDNFDSWTQFCENMKQMTDDDPFLPHNIVFSDEVTFELNGHGNKDNAKY